MVLGAAGAPARPPSPSPLQERYRPMLVVDAAAVRELFPMPAAIEQMREALERYSAATVVQPLRMVVQPSGAAGMMAAMPAWAGPDLGFGIKTVTIHPGNPARGLDYRGGAVALQRPSSRCA